MKAIIFGLLSAIGSSKKIDNMDVQTTTQMMIQKPPKDHTNFFYSYSPELGFAVASKTSHGFGKNQSVPMDTSFGE